MSGDTRSLITPSNPFPPFSLFFLRYSGGADTVLLCLALCRSTMDAGAPELPDRVAKSEPLHKLYERLKPPSSARKRKVTKYLREIR